MTILLFILLLIVSFVVLLYFFRPTATETAVQQHLETIEENRAVQGDGTTILRRQALSAIPWLDEFLRQIPGSVGAARLIRQSGRTWQVSSLFLVSLVVTVSVALAGIAGHSQHHVESAFGNRRRVRCPTCFWLWRGSAASGNAMHRCPKPWI